MPLLILIKGMIGILLVVWFYSLILLLLGKINRMLYCIIHPVVTIIFGTTTLGVFFFTTMIILARIAMGLRSVTVYRIIMALGLTIGILVTTRVYLINRKNKRYKIWVYVTSTIFGLPIAMLEFLENFELFSFWMSTVPIMYITTKVAVWYLRKREISKSIDQGLSPT